MDRTRGGAVRVSKNRTLDYKLPHWSHGAASPLLPAGLQQVHEFSVHRCVQGGVGVESAAVGPRVGPDLDLVLALRASPITTPGRPLTRACELRQQRDRAQAITRRAQEPARPPTCVLVSSLPLFGPHPLFAVPGLTAPLTAADRWVSARPRHGARRRCIRRAAEAAPAPWSPVRNSCTRFARPQLPAGPVERHSPAPVHLQCPDAARGRGGAAPIRPQHGAGRGESKSDRTKATLYRGASARMRQQYEDERERRRSTRRSLQTDGGSQESWHSLGAEYTEDARRRVRKAIKGNALFQHLPDRAVDAIFAEMVPLTVAAETMVFQEEEEAQMFYVVDSGRFASGDENGNKLEEFQEGDAIGEESLLAQARRTYNVVALTSGRLWAMDRLKYQQVLVTSSKRQAAQTISSLQNVPILQALSKEQLEILQDAFTKVCGGMGVGPSRMRVRVMTLLLSHLQVAYEPDTRILTEGEEGDTFYIVQEGRVECRHSADEAGSRCRVLGPGDYFGEGALLTKKPRSMCVTPARTALPAHKPTRPCPPPCPGT